MRAAGIVVLLFLAVAACRTRTPGPPPRIPGVRLLLVIVIDQGGAEILERARPLFRDGLRRLFDEGAWFDRAFHDHAVATTCPGHTTLATGAHPRHSGIIDNEWFDRGQGRKVNCVEDGWFGRSPARILVSGIGDWVKRLDSYAKVIAVSGKDRGAIPMAGAAGDGAYWYDPANGAFRSSRYYRRDHPRWLRLFNESAVPDTFFGVAWEPLSLDPTSGAARGFVQIDGGVPDQFPHLLGRRGGAPDRSFYTALQLSPFLDTATAAAARSAMVGEDLGTDEVLDLLSVSFSALDGVGHTYGPNSLEAQDALVRLDATIGDLIRFAERRTGPNGLLVALSADHAAMQLPEYLVATGNAAKREGLEDRACFRRAWDSFQERLGRDRWLEADNVLDRKTLERHGIDESIALETIRSALESCPTVARVRTRLELQGGEDAADPETRLYRNSFHGERSPDFYLQRLPFVLWEDPRGTSHRSPYAYDREVPIVLLGPGIARRKIDEPIATVDFAPTLAGLLGLPVDHAVDGVDRSELVLP